MHNFVCMHKLTSQQVGLQKSTSTSEDNEKCKECLIEELAVRTVRKMGHLLCARSHEELKRFPISFAA